jgi:hypothetical protein
LLTSELLDEAHPAVLQMLGCMLHACAVQKLMNADPVVFLLDAPSVWVDKHVPMALSALLEQLPPWRLPHINSSSATRKYSPMELAWPRRSGIS